MAFKKQYWSDKFEANLNRKVQLVDVVRADFEGEAKYGNTVNVYTYTDNINIVDYTGDDLTFQKLEPEQLSLLIDQQKAFFVAVDDITKLQGDPNAMDKFLSNAQQKMGRTIEEYLYGIMKDSVDPANIIDDSTVQISVDNVVREIEKLNIVLDKNDAPEERFVVIDPETYSYLKERGLIQTQYVKDQNLFGEIAIDIYGKMRVIKSSIVKGDGSTLEIIAGTYDAVRYIGAMTELEALRPEAQFTDAVKGLYVYGAKVFNGKKLAKLIVKDYV